eukprot:scaffold154272_cov32-Tisochrysis_lutea.AAC.1
MCPGPARLRLIREDTRHMLNCASYSQNLLAPTHHEAEKPLGLANLALPLRQFPLGVWVELTLCDGDGNLRGKGGASSGKWGTVRTQKMS